MTLGSRFRRQSGGVSPRLPIVVALLVCSFLVSGLHVTAFAQDATPEASPAGAPCVAPDVPDGTPEPMDDMAEMDMAASPEAEASAEASPVAEEVAPTPPSGTLIEDQAVIDEATGAVTNIYACLAEGNYLGAIAQTTDNFRTSVFGTSNLYSAAAVAEMYFAGHAETITTVNGVYDNGDGSISVDYQTSAGKQIFHYLDVLVYEDDLWKFDATFDLSPETDLDSQSVGLKFGTEDDEFAFAMDYTEFPATDATVFNVENTGDFGHEFELFMVPDGFDPASMTHPEQGMDLPEGVELIGGIGLDAGQSGQALFEGLEPGAYVIYCYYQTPTGDTHADQGMYLAITITEAVEFEVPDVVGTPAG